MARLNLETTFRGVAGQLPTGVAVVVTIADGDAHAATVSSVVPASFDPPLVVLCLAARSRTGDRLVRAGRFGVSFLDAADHAVALRFSRPERRTGWDSFAGLELIHRDPDPPILARATAWLDCQLDQVLPLGDHRCIVGAVVACGRRREAEPLVYYRGRFHARGPAVAAARWPASDPTDLAADW
jgi:flavin reductase (DIM6/NTAB) family NADH-FMN oxidoreductase RutF